MRRLFSTTPPPAPSNISEMLQKHKKLLDKEALAEIRDYYRSNKLQKLPMWKMGGFMRFFCQFARFQAYAYGVCSTGYLGYAIKQKWSKGEDTQRKIKIITPFIILTSIAAMFVCVRLTRLIAKEVSYYPELKQFGFRFYTNLFTTKEHLVNPSDITPLEIKSRSQAANYLIKVNGKQRKISTQVLGQWYNKRLFYHLLDGKTLEDEPGDTNFRNPPKTKKSNKK